MQEPYRKGVATHPGPESCGVTREGGAEALTGGRGGQPLSREIILPGRRRCHNERKATSAGALSRAPVGSRAVEDPVHARQTPCARTGRSRDHRS